MIRQYIGARYTPKFVGVYDATQQYENLEVVDNGSGTTYISKKIVPPNTPLTDTEYWAIYGASSGAILDLQTRMGTAENDIDALEGDVSDIQGDITDMQEDITQNTNDITALEQTIAGRNKRVVFITDSYGTHSQTNWCARCVSRWGIASGDDFIYAEGSTGFEHVGQGGHTFLTMLQAHSSDITNHNTITDIIVGGGTNDFYYLTTISNLAAAIAEFISYCHTEYPNAKVTLVFMGYDSKYPQSLKLNYIRTIKCYSESAISSGAKFINAYNVMHDYNNREDSQHPNELGNELLAQCVVNAFNGAGRPAILITEDNISDITAPAGATLSGTPKIHMTASEDEATVILDAITIDASMNWTAGQSILLGTYNPVMVPCIYNYRPITVVQIGSYFDIVRLQFEATSDRRAVNIYARPLFTRGAITSATIQGFFFHLPLVNI